MSAKEDIERLVRFFFLFFDEIFTDLNTNPEHFRPYFIKGKVLVVSKQN